MQERPADALAGDLVASINEPFWQARVEARALQLGGVDQESPRWLDIVEDVRQARLRRILARDAIGEVELRVEDLPCEDSMSGARFPFSALLSIADGDAVAGCARPASMPQPREPG
ncbi:hypothetical protein B1992_11255 [Pseudoxanthomonas broegbernensis]|uniref:Uncharacterized protein n=1 Tax=Pseudoxanthomonas broegbernensis TaxID=83619 RepID=A0A7V8GL34_9GAMM|nr:hypothetical protein [Pseudoxanthomonas broegbernensis]KAF1685541.1 hypothetical protein B1992_11255 [Pseudoxanthomonas broegbernensis]MBB6065911.1 putative membrane protein [Pseudoxanthomonas broegbernensis]